MIVDCPSSYALLTQRMVMKVTNHTVGGEGGVPKPALGESWKSIPHTRLLLSRDRGNNNCIVSIIKHSSMVSYLRLSRCFPSLSMYLRIGFFSCLTSLLLLSTTFSGPWKVSEFHNSWLIVAGTIYLHLNDAWLQP